ncbi:MAG: thiamine pyrophosphate-binding protein, partial [Deltaproteobacteria bacterium]|nr:thiamine pyrophosphate-binding protein [Deltaproteobacteria bacterium]
MKLTGGQIIGETLKKAGVKHCFGLVGHGNLGLIDGLEYAGIEFISCHNETIAGMAADGYFRATGKIGIVCLTCAPGALNTQLSVVTAAQDHSAVLYLTGDIPYAFAGKGTYEEVDLNSPDDQFNIMKPMFKRAWKGTNVKLFSQYITNALTTAITGRPGPVLVDIPFDLQTVEEDVKILNPLKHRPSSMPIPDNKEIKKTAELLLSAKNPTIFVGGGVIISRAYNEVLNLAEFLDIPIITSIMGAGAMPGDHPLVAGFIGSYGTELANNYAKKADLILAIGTRFEEEETAIWLDGEIFSVPPTKIIQIDINPIEIGKNYPVELGLIGDAKLSLISINKEIRKILKEKPVKRGTKEELKSKKEEWLNKLKPFINSDKKPINPRRLLYALNRYLPENGIIV